MQLQQARWLAALLLTIALIIVINGVPGITPACSSHRPG
jgi:hypothetical protein